MSWVDERMDQVLEAKLDPFVRAKYVELWNAAAQAGPEE